MEVAQHVGLDGIEKGAELSGDDGQMILAVGTSRSANSDSVPCRA
jgi:hypothetical protein